jgi:hypothetical protein
MNGGGPVVIGAIIAACVVLLVLAFVFPKLSIWPQRGGDRTLAAGQRGAGAAPGKLGRWLQKPFQNSRKAFNRSGSAGRRGRGKLPL